MKSKIITITILLTAILLITTYICLQNNTDTVSPIQSITEEECCKIITALENLDADDIIELTGFIKVNEDVVVGYTVKSKNIIDYLWFQKNEGLNYYTLDEHEPMKDYEVGLKYAVSDIGGKWVVFVGNNSNIAYYTSNGLKQEIRKYPFLVIKDSYLSGFGFFDERDREFVH